MTADASAFLPDEFHVELGVHLYSLMDGRLSNFTHTAASHDRFFGITHILINAFYIV